MRLAIMQPYIFPYIGYFQLISAVDKFVMYDDVNFINRGWINRNNLLVNGKANLFSIPVSNASQNRLIREISIADDVAWKIKLLKTIEHSYKKAPLFQVIFPIIESVLSENIKYINDLARLSIKAVTDYLGLVVSFVDSSVCYDNTHLKGQFRILDICKQEGADHYINPIGGMEIYSREMFDTEGITINFIKSLPIEYNQFDQAFVPNLSFIDVLMFNERPKVLQLLSQFQLV
jgi:hypothetical protein